MSTTGAKVHYDLTCNGKSYLQDYGGENIKMILWPLFAATKCGKKARWRDFHKVQIEWKKAHFSKSRCKLRKTFSNFLLISNDIHEPIQPHPIMTSAFQIIRLSKHAENCVNTRMFYFPFWKQLRFFFIFNLLVILRPISGQF